MGSWRSVLGGSRSVDARRGAVRGAVALGGLLLVTSLVLLGASSDLGILATAHPSAFGPPSPGSAFAASGGSAPAAWGPPALHYTLRAPAGPVAGTGLGTAGASSAAAGTAGWAPPAMPTGPGGFSGGMHCASKMTRMMAIGTAA